MRERPIDIGIAPGVAIGVETRNYDGPMKLRIQADSRPIPESPLFPIPIPKAISICTAGRGARNPLRSGAVDHLIPISLRRFVAPSTSVIVQSM
jgi:hypothetical protein